MLLLFLISTSFYLQAHEIETDKCSKIYFAPILSENFPKIYKPISHSLFTQFNFFFDHCEEETINFRKMKIVFNFIENATKICLSGNTPACNQQLEWQYLKYLNQSHKYFIEDLLKEAIQVNNACLSNSVLLFFTDISCEYFPYYPDIYQIFGEDNFNETLNFLLGNQLQTYFFVVNNVKDPMNVLPKICDYMQNLTFEYNSSYFKVDIFQYYPMDAFNIDSPTKRGICNSTIPLPPDDSVKKELKNNTTTIISIVCGIILGLIILFIIFWARQIWRRWKESKIEAFADQHSRNVKNIIFGKYKDEWEVTPKELKVEQDKVLGQGAFGKVYKGYLKKTRNKEYIEMGVAVKFTHDSSDEKTRKEMIDEVGFMKALGSHENLLVMVGYVKSIENPMICTVYCSNGDLLKILRKHPLHFMTSNRCQNVKICLLLPDLLRIAIEVCSGLEYLSLFGYVHRDVAARNVLLTDQMMAKLADFGMCKKLELNDICIIDKNGKFPIKHMCYESLKFGEFSTKTDVWSFGILIWEMFSGGQSPFKNVPNNEFIEFLEKDGKPEFPQETHQPLVQFLSEKIFQKYPSRRADFKDIKQELSQFYAIVLSVVQKL